MKKKEWKDLDATARKWIRGWVAVMCKDMSQKIVFHDQFDDTMLFYYLLPQTLTKEQFEKTDISKTVEVDWENDRFVIQNTTKTALGRHDFPISGKSTEHP